MIEQKRKNIYSNLFFKEFRNFIINGNNKYLNYLIY